MQRGMGERVPGLALMCVRAKPQAADRDGWYSPMMSRPIVIAHHLIFTAYGWWLPNDPRGSNSKTIRDDVIADLGEIHQGRKRVQPASGEIREFYREADKRLRHELVTFDERDTSAVASAFEEVIKTLSAEPTPEMHRRQVPLIDEED